MAKSQKTRRQPPRIASSSDRPQRARRPTGRATPDDPIVLDDLPKLIPVTARELDTIQIYLGDLIDRLIADAVSPAGTKPVHPEGREARRGPAPRA